jgi:chromate reductase
MKFLCVAGSIRAASTNRALLHAMAADAPQGIDLAIYEEVGRLPIFNPDDEGERTPAVVTRLIDAAISADGIIIACPEYAHGVPGGIKNALDWLVSGPAAVGKPAMLVHASPRSLFAREALREILKTMSFAVFDGNELEIPLIGKKPDEWESILAEPAHQAVMRETLAAFEAFVRRQ